MPGSFGILSPPHSGRLTVLLLAVLSCVTTLPAQAIERAEALWKQGRYDDANNAFRAAVAAHPKNPDYRVRWGRFFLARFNAAEAEGLFKEALELKSNHAGALLGMALVAADSFERRAVEFAERALEADATLLEARELLARLALEENDEARATREADRAMAMSPRALDAMAIRATIDLLHDRQDTPWLPRILAEDPKYGRAYETAARFFVLNRRYEEGIAFYRRAIALQPDLWSARSQLGINLMRLGLDDEARKHLELAYNNGHKDAATVNTLRLLDSYKNFDFIRSGNIILKLDRKEAALLRPYFEAELKRAIAAFDRKYGFRLERPVQLEVYPNHDDFAVRTLGMPGLGALGVTFGYVVAMDSPSGRKPGSFHWASTLWHELSHVYVLSATKHRVPRWFTEGMAVHEETAASPEWGDRLGPEVIAAIKEKKLLPVAQLDRGFVRQAYPGQVVVSYFQAGRICDYINREWGYAKLLAMMHDFARGTPTPEVIEKQLGIKPEEFDKRFLAALEVETRKSVEGFDDWRKRIKEVAEFARAKRHDDVIREGTAIRDLYPEYVEAGSVYEFLAEAYEAKGDKTAATAELERYARAGGRNPDSLKKLAALCEEAGKKKEAAAALDRVNYVNPLDEDVHNRLGALWLAEGNVQGAIREFTAAVARNPIDPAAAHYNLARAWRAANRNERAKEQLLMSLEAAPGFRPAQKMLLELSK
jgi:tetratricopeptide (TPR) repeat protein